MDAVSNVVKRNVLAEHLREVIDILEQKVRICEPVALLSCLIFESGRSNRILIRFIDIQG